jgi:3-oxoacyl-[acyl-carrier protein] reductase
MFDLSGKVALVTGASGGIGGAITRLLHRSGASVVCAGTRQEALDAIVESLGDRAVAAVGNLTDPATPDALLKAAETAFGQVDIVVNNAALTRDGLALRMKDDDWTSVLEVNLTASFRLARAALRGMMKRRYGRIVSITSVVGVAGNPGQANYCASKAGLIGMTKALAAEVATRGITVNCVAPGLIDTAMTEILTEAQRERMLSGIPAGRTGTPDDIASAVLYLASGEAAYVTGQTLHVNGGMLMV